MTDTHEITVVAPVVPTYIERPAALHPLVAMAQKQSGEIDVETLRELMALQREYEAGEAKKAFTVAMVALKAEMPTVIDRDGKVAFGTTKYTHATLANAINTVTPYLAKHGFELSWSAENGSGQVKTTCKLAHRDGHVETMTLQADPDKSGNKNSIQAIGSTITYLQRYSALALLGIATADMKDCDDGEKVDKIDQSRNLIALASMAQVSMNQIDCERQVGKPIEEWTESDLKQLRKMKDSLKKSE
jgi:hypothetical protein